MSYNVIYADPPWRYDFSRSKSRKIENQYPTLGAYLIADYLREQKIPVDQDAVLYLWATSPKLLVAERVMKAWGFLYKSSMVWDKERMGMGYWFRGQHELLLVGTKGKFSPPPPETRVPSVLRCARGEHSAKPGIVRGWIQSWFPQARALELFARWEGDEYWDTHGLEAKQ